MAGSSRDLSSTFWDCGMLICFYHFSSFYSYCEIIYKKFFYYQTINTERNGKVSINRCPSAVYKKKLSVKLPVEHPMEISFKPSTCVANLTVKHASTVLVWFKWNSRSISVDWKSFLTLIITANFLTIANKHFFYIFSNFQVKLFVWQFSFASCAIRNFLRPLMKHLETTLNKSLSLQPILSIMIDSYRRCWL